MTLKEYTDLKARVERQTIQLNQCLGSLQQVQASMKEQFGVYTLDKAKALVKTLDADEKKLQWELDKAMEDFEEKWGEQL